MLPMRMAFRRKRMSVSLRERNFSGQFQRSTGVEHGQKEYDADVLWRDVGRMWEIGHCVAENR
jgi:hypothetical protein